MAPADTLREELSTLQQQKEDMEAQASDIQQELTFGFNAPGFKGPLVDKEGYPRSDIDVYRVRHQRHRFAVLQTDHKQTMKRIEEILCILLRAPEKAILKGRNSDASVKNTEEMGDERALRPFAIVQNVQHNSPAEKAGLHVQDKILQFGSANAENHRNMEAIRDIVTHHMNKPIVVLVSRMQDKGVKKVELVLTPQNWNDTGALGCVLTQL